MPAAAKLSLYRLIFKDNNQSSTELNCVRSGASGARGLQAWLAAILRKVSGQQMSLSKVLTMDANNPTLADESLQDNPLAPVICNPFQWP